MKPYHVAMEEFARAWGEFKKALFKEIEPVLKIVLDFLCRRKK